MADSKNGDGSVLYPAAVNPYVINLATFSKRLKALYAHWNEFKNDYWGGSEALSVAEPPDSYDLQYLKSTALNIWLLGFEFPETITVFTRKQIHFLCRQKKASLLEAVKSAAKEAVGVDVVMHIKTKNDDGLVLMDSIFHAIFALSKEDIPVVGHIAKEAPDGNFLVAWSGKLKDSKIRLTDITGGLSELFSVKYENEINCIKKAAYLSASVLKDYMVPELESIIDEEKKVTHAYLMDDAEKVIFEPNMINVKLKASNIDICYLPIFQSGGVFDLRPGAFSNDDYLYYDSGSVIICAIGARYNSYCSNVARTILIDATPSQSKAYEVLLKAQEAAIGMLKPGNKTSDAYQAALLVVEKDAPELLANLTESVGTGIGIEFCESGLNLNSKNDKVLKENMVFNVSIGFQDLYTEINKPKSQNFSLLLADTVIVKPKPEILTSKSSKAVKDVAYKFNGGGEEEEVTSKVNVTSTKALLSKATLRSVNQEMSKDELLRQHQAELARQKNEETARRLAGGGTGTGRSQLSARSSSELTAYKNVNDMPTHRELMIQIDQKNEAVLLPINGSMVPFHVATIRTASSQQDTNRNSYIRIIFNVPGAPFNPLDSNTTLKFQNSIYLKEVSMRSKDPRHSNEVVQLIKTLKRQVLSRESERAERATLVSQEKLILSGSKFKPIRLSDLWIRPVFGGCGRKLTGTLEVHTNGFRFSTSRAEERVDIMIGNIKHAIFQPAQKEMITLIHFHLHNHIMVGNKKSKDVQFYVEVMDVVQTLGGTKRSAYDPDEIEEEQRERDSKNKINMEFKSFVNGVHDLWAQPHFKGLNLEFDEPIRDLGFYGVPHKTSAFIIPSSSCLIELIETPFLVITLSEIEIVNLERVGLEQKNFDMAIVFKDFKRDVMRIDSIPSTSLDGIKEWLDIADLKYYESRLNLNWRPILKNIMDDPKAFLDEGGWEFLNLEASDSNSEQQSGESGPVLLR